MYINSKVAFGPVPFRFFWFLLSLIQLVSLELMLLSLFLIKKNYCFLKMYLVMIDISSFRKKNKTRKLRSKALSGLISD